MISQRPHWCVEYDAHGVVAGGFGRRVWGMVWRSDSSTPIHETLECIGNVAGAVSNYFSPHRWSMEKHCYEIHTEGLVYSQIVNLPVLSNEHQISYHRRRQ